MINNFIKNNNIINIIIFIIILISIEIGVIVTTYYIFKINSDNYINKKMINLNKNLYNNIDNEISEIKYYISRTAAFFRINGIYLSADNYSDMINIIESQLESSIESFIVILKLLNSEKDNYQKFCSNYIIQNCTIKQINFSSSIISFSEANGRPYYFPLIYLYPLLSNYISLIGLDFSYENNNITFISMLLENNTNYSGTVRIGISKPSNNDNPYTYGVLLGIPIFKNISYPDLENIYGFSTALIRIYDIYYKSFIGLNNSINIGDIDFFAFDITDDDYTIKNNKSLLYKENKLEYQNIWFAEEVNIDYKTFILNYKYANRNWTFYFKYNNNFIIENTNNLVIIIPSVITSIFIFIDLVIIAIYALFNNVKKKVFIKKEQNLANQMLNYVNHEVRNPLNVIKGLVIYILDIVKNIKNSNGKILINKLSFDALVSDLYTISSSCDMLEQIVTDILYIRKLEAGKIDLDNKIINLSDFIKEIQKSILQKTDENKFIQLYYQYDKNAIYYFDSFRMKQILVNLLTNSIKYTNEGSITLKIEEIDNSVIFSVTDTGIGIKKEHLDIILNPFEHLNENHNKFTNGGGIGLGLYLCKMLVVRMGGIIDITSEYQHGCKICIKFPLELFRVNNNKIEI